MFLNFNTNSLVKLYSSTLEARVIHQRGRRFDFNFGRLIHALHHSFLFHRHMCAHTCTHKEPDSEYAFADLPETRLVLGFFLRLLHFIFLIDYLTINPRAKLIFKMNTPQTITINVTIKYLCRKLQVMCGSVSCCCKVFKPRLGLCLCVSVI